MTSSDSVGKRSVWKDRRVVLSTLWVFLVLNFLYADVFTLFFDPAARTQTSDMSSGFVLFFAVIMETSMIMVFLSRVLPQAWNRWTNVGAAVLHAAVLSWSLTEGAVTSYYAFFATVEIATLLFVIGYAWSWRKQSATL
jgi:phosphatidylglycerophosphate synthase